MMDTDAEDLKEIRELTGDPSAELEDILPDALERVEELLEEHRATAKPGSAPGAERSSIWADK